MLRSALEVPLMRHDVLTSLITLAATGLLTGCPDRSISEVDPAQGRVEYKDIPINVNRDVDILFVIDDSPSMRDKQTNLANNFPKFIEVLSKIEGGLPNVHIGVVTSDLGTKGADDAAPGAGIGTIGKGGCSGLGKDGNLQLFGAPVSGGQFISDILQMNGTRSRNYSGNLADVFSTMARVGDGGCGFEQHLEAAKQALNGNPVNTGFLRDNAYLAIIFIVDEDDCSMSHSTLLGNDNATLGPPQSFRCTRFGVLCDQNGSTPNAMNVVGPKSQCHPNDASPYLTKIADYVDFFKSLKSNPTKVVVAGVMGTNEPFATELRVPTTGGNAIPALAHSCSYIGADNKPEVADPPIRLKFFLDQFPNRSTFAPICQRDLSGGLQQIGDLLRTVIGNPCIEGNLADADPKTPEPDYDCSVSAVTNFGLMNQSEEILARCSPDSDSPSNPPCWRLAVDNAKCPTSDHLILKVIEDPAKALDQDTHIVANCVTEAE
jgi:hypothetical protein